MPVRSRHPLLAGVAALLGLGITGCVTHTNLAADPFTAPAPPAVSMAAPQAIQQVQMVFPPVVSTTAPPSLAGEAPPPAARPVVQMGRPNRKPLFGGASSAPPAITPPTAAPGLRPVPPAPGVVPARQDAVIFGPAHRTLPDTGGAAPRPPHVVGYIPSGSAGAPMPLPVGTAIPEKEEKKGGDLPAPREDKSTAAPPATMPARRVGVLSEGPSGVIHPLEAPREFQKRALSAYIVEPPDVLAIELAPYLNEGAMPITGPHLVRPDGSVGLGAIGSVFVAGLTLADAKERIAAAIFSQRRSGPEKEKEGRKAPTLDDIRAGLKVDVQAYNSKFYYVVTDGAGYGAQVFKVPCTGNEMVLDAIAQVQGLPAVSSPKKIWIARATPHGGHANILPVDFHGIVMAGSASTNYQLFPGDRLFVHSDPRIRADTHIAKVLAPIERILGVTLLGSSVVNSIRNRNGNGNNNFGN